MSNSITAVQPLDEQYPAPECAVDCVWFETDQNQSSCVNRCCFVCKLHRADIFGREKAEERGIGA